MSGEPRIGRRRLANYQGLSVLPLASKRALVFGALFVAAGIYPMLAGMGWVEVEPGSIKVEPWVVAVVGGMFSGIGLWISGTGLVGLALRRRAERRRALSPHEPWSADHDWNPERLPCFTGRHLAQQAFGTMVVLAFALVLEGIRDEAPAIFGLVGILLNLLAAWAVFSLGRELFRALRFAGIALRAHSFPLFLGRRGELRLELPPALHEAERLELCLRHVVEVFTTETQRDGDEVQVVRFDEYYSRRWTLESSELRFTDVIPLSLELPALRAPSRLSEAPRRYWELEVRAERPGPDLRFRALLPVYEDPSAKAPELTELEEDPPATELPRSSVESEEEPVEATTAVP